MVEKKAQLTVLKKKYLDSLISKPKFIILKSKLNNYIAHLSICKFNIKFFQYKFLVS